MLGAVKFLGNYLNFVADLRNSFLSVCILRPYDSEDCRLGEGEVGHC